MFGSSGPDRTLRWRRLVLHALAVGVLWSAASDLSFGEADGPDYWRVVGVRPGSVLNVRERPEPDSRKIGTLPHDATHLQNLGCQGEPSLEEWTAMSVKARLDAKTARWCKIRHDGRDGWVAGRYLSEDLDAIQ